ncbi:MAG TPA: FHA domain-containing protein [Conexibacter sp.]|jgi:hypothetical protein|nr:FHA domain-containing protein [Conexibacter sp.]
MSAVHELTPGLLAVVGELELRVVDCVAEIAGAPVAGDDGADSSSCVVRPPSASIGRGEQADVRLVGPAADGISRHHLVVRASDRGWTVRDCSSSGTWEWIAPQGGDGPHDWWRLPPGVAIPVQDGLTLCLGPDLRLRIATRRAPLPGGVTPGSRKPSRGQPERIRPATLERLAAELLAPRRERRDLRVPSPIELMATLDIEHATLYDQARRLRALPEVSRYVSTGQRRVGLDETAEAVARAFPYLLGDA